MKVKAILFDTRSIQRYIFSGSQLKTNIGASYLVDRVFDDALLAVLRDSWAGKPIRIPGVVTGQLRLIGA